jgi:hypothetical protein
MVAPVSRYHSEASSLFAWLINHQPAVLFSHNKPATSNQPAVLFSQNKPAPAISDQPNEQAAELYLPDDTNGLTTTPADAVTFDSFFGDPGRVLTFVLTASPAINTHRIAGSRFHR